jgi:O-antigen/teichoic acid export membrane protein
MNTVQRILKNTLALGVARLLQIGHNILLVLLISRYFQAAGLGVYSTSLAFLGTSQRWVELGIFNFLTREIPRDLSRSNLYMINLGVLSFAVTLCVITIIYLLVPVFNYSDETAFGIYIISLALIPIALNSILEAVLISHERVEFITCSQLVGNGGAVLGAIYLLTSGYGVGAVIINFSIFAYVNLGVRIYFSIKYVFKPKWEFDFRFLRKLIGQLKDFTLLGILGGLFTRETEIIILSLFAIDKDVGFYAAGLKLVTIWYIIPSTFMSVVFPHLSKSFEQSKDKFSEIQTKSVKYLMALALPLGVGLTVLGDQIIRLIYGSGFEKAVPALHILAWMPILFFLSGVLWRTLLARNQQHIALRALIISLPVKVIASVTFIMWFGYLGAAIGLGVAYVFYVFLHMYYVWKGGAAIAVFRITWRFMIGAILMGVFSWYLSNRMGIHLLINVALSASVYAGLIFLLRAFSPNDIDLFRNLFRRRLKSIA